jgi:hypothetical protein
LSGAAPAAPLVRDHGADRDLANVMRMILRSMIAGCIVAAATTVTVSVLWSFLLPGGRQSHSGDRAMEAQRHGRGADWNTVKGTRPSASSCCNGVTSVSCVHAAFTNSDSIP